MRGGELVEVGVGNADVDDVRADVGDSTDRLLVMARWTARFHCCDVAGAGGAVGGVDALAETGVGREGDGRNGRAAGESEGGVDAVLSLLLHVLDEGELRSGEGRGDARLIDEDDAEAGADDGLGREQVGKADARGDVVPVQLACAAWSSR